MKKKLNALIGALAFGGLIAIAGVAGAAVTISGTQVVLSDNTLPADGSSHQAVEADATLAADFDGYYGGAVMGNVYGASLVASDATNGEQVIGGLIGKYNVDGDGAVGALGGVIGEIGEDSANNGNAAAFVAVIGGDTAAITAGAAYGVRYLNSTPGVGFDYGLDLFSDAIGSYQPVTYGTADIRLQNGDTITNTEAGVINFGDATLTTDVGGAFAGYLIAINPGDDLADGDDTSGTCGAANKGAIVIDTGNNFFGCDGDVWQQLDL